ncbi:MAG: bifunctional DNA-formamidopyrimidine glycosylase/DNA-(apurinic or apyrimidinic site) lyase [bacterium]
MPELPEVETVRRSITPLILGKTVDSVVVRSPQLRWPVPRGIASLLAGQRVRGVERRGKYLILRFAAGSVILHLGMSGRILICSRDAVYDRHDHIDLVFKGGRALRLRDPRRFGALLWTREDPLRHQLLSSLGPEPLGDGFSGSHLYRCARGRKAPVKHLIMDGRVVAGVGNIYAAEALFAAGIHPGRAAGRISRPRCERLAGAIREVLEEAVDCGGTTLRDFHDPSGSPGLFQPRLMVYGREGQPCRVCASPVAKIAQGQRSTYFCRRCQR